MQYQKQVIATDMPKCYAIGMFDGRDGRGFLVGVEKEGPTRRFSLDGSQVDVPAEGPGGVMTITQVPGRDDQFLSTTEFYSPNCGGNDARISSYTLTPNGSWACRTLCDLPYVHRFGIVFGADGTMWLLACSIKSACAYKEDWRFPGRVFGAPLVESLESYDEDYQLELTELSDNQLKNHGFYLPSDRSFALVSTNDGVFRYVAPEKVGEPWGIERILKEPTSDIALVDFDGDGRDELLTLSPFHGETLSVWHLDDAGEYQLAWRDPVERPFLHAIWGGRLCGEPCAIVGHRKGERDLLRVFFDAEKGYQLELIDHDRGPTNVWVYNDGTTDRIIAANRETDEVALYACSK